MTRRFRVALCTLVLASLPTACKLVRNDAGTPSDRDGAPGAGAASGAAADIDARWESEILPHLASSATDWRELKERIAIDPDAAGERHGHRAGAEGAAWNFAVRFDGTVVAADTDSRAATADIDVDGDGTADAIVQLGPVIRGTTLRDVLPFVDFTSFRDQIEFAKFARALNTRAHEGTSDELSRDSLPGTRLSVLGAFTLGDADDDILVTPVTLAPADTR